MAATRELTSIMSEVIRLTNLAVGELPISDIEPTDIEDKGVRKLFVALKQVPHSLQAAFTRVFNDFSCDVLDIDTKDYFARALQMIVEKHVIDLQRLQVQVEINVSDPLPGPVLGLTTFYNRLVAAACYDCLLPTGEIKPEIRQVLRLDEVERMLRENAELDPMQRDDFIEKIPKFLIQAYLTSLSYGNVVPVVSPSPASVVAIRILKQLGTECVTHQMVDHWLSLQPVFKALEDNVNYLVSQSPLAKDITCIGIKKENEQKILAYYNRLLKIIQGCNGGLFMRNETARALAALRVEVMESGVVIDRKALPLFSGLCRGSELLAAIQRTNEMIRVTDPTCKLTKDGVVSRSPSPGRS